MAAPRGRAGRQHRGQRRGPGARRDGEQRHPPDHHLTCAQRQASGVLPGSRSSATAAQQVGRGDGTEEAGPHGAVGVGDDSRRDGLDPVAMVQVLVSDELDLLRDHALALQVARLVPDASARVARRRGEDRDQPRRLGPFEVGPGELLRHRVARASRHRLPSLPALDDDRHDHRHCCQSKRQQKPFHRLQPAASAMRGPTETRLPLIEGSR